MDNKSSIRKKVVSTLRIVGGIVLALFLIKLVADQSKADIMAELKAGNSVFLVYGLLLYGATIFMGAQRWRILLRVQGVNLSYYQAAKLTLMGMFFNSLIPGAVSGDLVKLGFVIPLAKEKKPELALTMVLDRVLGLFGLLFCTGLMIALCFKAVSQMDSAALKGVLLIIGIGSFGGVIGLLLLEFNEKLRSLVFVRKILAIGEKYLPKFITSIIVRFTDAVNLYRKDKLSLLKAMLISVGIHLSLGTSLLCIGRGLYEKAVGAIYYILTMQMGNFAGSIPATPGGYGMRDQTILKLLELFGAETAKAGSIPLLYSLCMFFWALVGAVAFAIPDKGKQDA